MRLFALIFVVLLAAYAFYEFLFFAWLTATPLTPNQPRHAQHLAEAWFIVSVISFVLALGSMPEHSAPGGGDLKRALVRSLSALGTERLGPRRRLRWSKHQVVCARNARSGHNC